MAMHSPFGNFLIDACYVMLLVVTRCNKKTTYTFWVTHADNLKRVVSHTRFYKTYIEGIIITIYSFNLKVRTSYL